MLRRVFIAAVVVVALVASATSFAARGYRLYDAAWHRPPSGSLFSVNAHGVTAQKALLYVYLDRQPCQSTWAREVRLNIRTFKAGQSGFRDAQNSFTTLWVSGRFNTSFTARAGTTAQVEYACAYLTTPNSHGDYRITAANASNAYAVTN
jgi:hypothetical protein